MEKCHLAAEPLLQMGAEHRAHLGELRENQCIFVDLDHFVEYLDGALQFARSASERRAIPQVMRRVVAHLLETQHCRQYQSAPFNPFSLVDAPEHFVHDGAIKRRLLPGEVAQDLHL